jgi:hypothetical protein
LEDSSSANDSRAAPGTGSTTQVPTFEGHNSCASLPLRAQNHTTCGVWRARQKWGCFFDATGPSTAQITLNQSIFVDELAPLRIGGGAPCQARSENTKRHERSVSPQVVGWDSARGISCSAVHVRIATTGRGPAQHPPQKERRACESLHPLLSSYGAQRNSRPSLTTQPVGPHGNCRGRR